MSLKFCRPHNDYSSPKGRLIADQIFQDFSGFQRSDAVEIERKYGVPQRTVRGWHFHWTLDRDWSPWDTRKRRMAHLIFSLGEEFEIAQRIWEEISVPGTLFTDADFRAIAMEEYMARYWREDEDWRLHSSFQDSNGFIAGFKKGTGFPPGALTASGDRLSTRVMRSMGTGNRNTTHDSAKVCVGEQRPENRNFFPDSLSDLEFFFWTED
jgi:hypothetical protein